MVVSTLRFWTAADQPTAVQRRKHIQQPISLLLQLIAMLLLLLAISQLRVGTEAAAARRHVLVLETSAWMASRANGQTLMDAARARARAYLRAIPSSDQVMIIRANALATPVTPFESDRRKLEAAIAQSEPAAGSLNIEQALAVARTAQANSNGRGEIVFIGSGRVNESDAAPEKNREFACAPCWRNQRQSRPAKNRPTPVGNRSRSLGHSGFRQELWLARSRSGFCQRPCRIRPAGAQRILIPPNSEREATFNYRTRAAGILKLRLLPNDAFPDDNHAQVELPAEQPLTVTVYSDQPEQLKPILAANKQIAAVYKPVSQYSASDKGLVLLDRFRPTSRPSAPSIWIDPPADNSPIPVRARVTSPPQLRWRTDNVIGAGLRTRDVHLPAVSVFNTAPGDMQVAEVDQGPVIVARPTNPKIVTIGFQPAAIRYELATPLLFANIFRWMEPDTFLEKQINTQPVGTVNVSVAPGTDPATIRVLRPDGTPIPFTIQGESVHFYSGTPGSVRVLTGDRESIYSLSLPELADSKWAVPDSARKGLPTFRETASSHDIWQGLAVLAAAILLFEWIRWGRASKRVSPSTVSGLKRAA